MVCDARSNGGVRHMMHAGQVGVIASILKDVSVPNMCVVTKAKGLRGADASRPGDVVALDFFAEG